MRKLTPMLLLLLIITTTLVHAQVVDLDKDRLPVSPLPTLWRFHAGDNPAWADPKFDDSNWPLLHSDRSWDSQGYKATNSMAWYRFQIIIPSNVEHVSLSLPEIWTSFEVFSDGALIGTLGKMPPHPVVYDADFDGVYAIPPAKKTATNIVRNVTVSIRVWQSPQAKVMEAGGPQSAGGIAGESNQIEHFRDLNLAREFKDDASQAILALLSAFVALAAISLFLLRRKELEYFWFGLIMGSYAVVTTALVTNHTWNDKALFFTLSMWDVTNALFYIAFFLQLFQPRRNWLFKLAVACTLSTIPTYSVITVFPALRNTKLTSSIDDLLILPCTIWILVVLISAARRKSLTESRWIDARLLLLPFLLQTSIVLIRRINDVTIYILDWQHLMINYDIAIIKHPFPVSVSDLIQVTTMLGFLAILVLRFSRTSGEQERYAAEVEGARHVQQFLIPEALPQVPGLAIESDYRPAREVGGDFFQIIPNPEDGSALILVGDVAGKGMQAGMLATLIVGAMRTAATFTTDPVVILATLNNRLHGKGNATCLALRIEANGAATLVNAGHLPPYLNGVELPMEGALPLGTIPNIEFPILNFQISPGDTLTLISDGILEAQKPDGELFGFDRIVAQLRQSTSAAMLATAAQDFGQSDDITVLTIARTAFVNL